MGSRHDFARPGGGSLDRSAPENVQLAPRGSQLQKQQRQQHRVSQESTGDQSISTSSPVNSPISPAFPPQLGLAPRPQSFPYKGHRSEDISNATRGQRSGEDTVVYDDLDTLGVPEKRVRRHPMSFSARVRTLPTGMEDEPVEDRPERAEGGKQSHGGDIQGIEDPVTEASSPFNEHVRTRASSKQLNARALRPQTGRSSSSGTLITSTSGKPTRSRTVSAGHGSFLQARPKWAPDRSPLQKLELTLQDITKEEKRAQLEEAEILLRESKAGRETFGFTRGAEDTALNRLLGDAGLRDTHLAEAGLVRNLSIKQTQRIQRSATLDSRRLHELRSIHGEPGNELDYQQQRIQGEQQATSARRLSALREDLSTSRDSQAFKGDNLNAGGAVHHDNQEEVRREHDHGVFRKPDIIPVDSDRSTSDRSTKPMPKDDTRQQGSFVLAGASHSQTNGRRPFKAGGTQTNQWRSLSVDETGMHGDSSGRALPARPWSGTESAAPKNPLKISFKATAARLTVADLDLRQTIPNSRKPADKAWWESERSVPTKRRDVPERGTDASGPVSIGRVPGLVNDGKSIFSPSSHVISQETRRRIQWKVPLTAPTTRQSTAKDQLRLQRRTTLGFFDPPTLGVRIASDPLLIRVFDILLAFLILG